LPPCITHLRSGLTTSQASAFSPCNITGFFRVHDSARDPLRVGSTGAGVAIETGVTTRVRLRRTKYPRIIARFNGQQLTSKAVSTIVAGKYFELDNRSWEAEITHKSEVRSGRGYGTSGAGALGLSLALNEAMGLSLSNAEAAQIAHVCEVERMTGLGTVTSVFSGGLTVRTIPGAPEIGNVRKFSLPPSLRVVSASFGPISTRRILGNLDLKKTINACGRALVARFLRESSYSNFMIMSRKFSNCVGLVSSRLRRVMNALDSSGFNCSMMMLGESLFCLLPLEDVERVEAIFRSNGLRPMISKIARSGARLI
jgi:pantoate kinase